jgi:hypothetical protein
MNEWKIEERICTFEMDQRERKSGGESNTIDSEAAKQRHMEESL